MNRRIVYRQLAPTDVPDVCDLIARVFNEYVASGYSLEGISEFLRYVHPDRFRDRAGSVDLAFVAEQAGKILGIIEVVNCSHVALLFVDGVSQRTGIGKELVRHCIKMCKEDNPGLIHLTVNSSPNAVTAYMKVGFAPTGEEETVNGIRFVPMLLPLIDVTHR